MIYVVKAFKRFDYLCVRLVFFEFGAAYGYGNRINAQSRARVSGIDFDIVDLEPQTPYRADEILQIDAVLEFEVHFEMVRAVLQIAFRRRKKRQADIQNDGRYQRYRIISRADGEPEYPARPEPDGSRKPLYLAARADEKRVDAYDRDAYDARAGNHEIIEPEREFEENIKKHRERRRH